MTGNTLDAPGMLDTQEYVTYEQAAEIIGVKTQSVKQIVGRKLLHSVPAQDGTRKRLLARAEVMDYAQMRAKHPRGLPARPIRSLAQGATPQDLAMIGMGIGVIGLLILALQSEERAVERVLIIGALVALALLLLATWQEEGKIDARERRRLERLAQDAERQPEPFITELQALIGAA